MSPDGSERGRSMFYLVTGGSAGGKSEYAEALAVRLAQEVGVGRLIYLAAMKPYGDEGQRRIARHRKLRAGKGFMTVESALCDTEILKEQLGGDCVVLLEDLMNLTANELYDRREAAQEAVFTRVMEYICHIRSAAAHLIAVTGDVFSDGIGYDEETGRYTELLGNINRSAAAQADRVWEVVCGIPIAVK